MMFIKSYVNLNRKKQLEWTTSQKLVRDCASEISSPLTYIINLSLTTSTGPSDWKLAKVIPLFKSGKSSEVDNYRPISILPILSKVQEKIVHRQLMNHLEENKLLFNKQFGFRSNKSTELAATYFMDHLRSEMDNGKLIGAVFIDLSKAFDTISHAGLLNKLPEYGITSTEHNWIADYLFNRKQVVCFDNIFSNQQSVYSGVPQGSVLGPLLFLIHFNDIATCLKNCRVVKYADDTVIFFSDRDPVFIQNKISEVLSVIKSWLDSNDLIMNLKPGKTEAMLFGTSNRLNKLKNQPFEVHVNDNVVHTTDRYKYLGVKLDSSLILSENFSGMYRKAAGRLRLLYRFRNSITLHTAKCIYESFMVPTLMYCAVSNLHLNLTQVKRLDNIRRRSAAILKGQSTATIRLTSIYDLMKIRACSLVARSIKCSEDYECFNDYFTLTQSSTRNSQLLLRLPRFKLEVGKKQF